ncbi:Peptide-transporting ATPase protein, partial [Dioscorea alata]
MAFYAIAVNMVAYLVREMHQSLPDAATHVNDWVGAAFVLTILGAFLADAYLGRFLTIVIFTLIYSLGMIMLTLSAAISNLRPPPCTEKQCPQATTKQTTFLYMSLALIALGTGGIKPCVSSFGADQFDEADEKEAQKKYSFFNWFFFAINMGVLMGITLMVYVEVKKGWVWGFGVPTASTVMSVVVLVAGAPVYRYQKATGSALSRFVQVVVVAWRNHWKGVRVVRVEELYEVKTRESVIVGARKLGHTSQYSFLDKAAVITDLDDPQNTSKWRLCTVTQVEELKSFVRVLPIWASTIALSISFAQLSTFFITQSTTMDRKLGNHFVIPPGSVPVFAALNGLLLVPLYESIVVPILRRITGHRRGITSLQRIGVGLFISIFAMASAAIIESKRQHNKDSLNMTVFWLLPQFFLMGSAEVFTYVGQLEFFYDEATDGTRSLSSAMFLSEIGIGSWLSTALVKIIERVTGGVEKGWLRNSLNESRLDKFYWVLCAINAVNFVVYVFVAMVYRGREESHANDAKVVDEGSVVGHGGDEEEL